MRPSKPMRYYLSAVSVSATIAISNPAQAQGPDETREYKCFADRADQSQTVFYYYDQADLPSRFSDDDTIAMARIPNSLRDSTSLIHECVLRDLNFFNPLARTLEIQQPQ